MLCDGALEALVGGRESLVLGDGWHRVGRSAGGGAAAAGGGPGGRSRGFLLQAGGRESRQTASALSH